MIGAPALILGEVFPGPMGWTGGILMSCSYRVPAHSFVYIRSGLYIISSGRLLERSDRRADSGLESDGADLVRLAGDQVGAYGTRNDTDPPGGAGPADAADRPTRRCHVR